MFRRYNNIIYKIRYYAFRRRNPSKRCLDDGDGGGVGSFVDYARLGRDDQENQAIQRVVPRRAQSAPQERHETHQTRPTHWIGLQRNVDEQNGNHNSKFRTLIICSDDFK